MGYSDDDYSQDTTEGALDFWQRLHPGIRSAVILWVFLIASAVLNSVTAGSSAVFCYPVQLVLYVGNGALASHFARGSGYQTRDLPRVGALAGFIAWILPALFYLIFGLLLGVATLGIGFVGIAAWVLCGPVDLAVQVGCGILGAWLYGRFAGGTESGWLGYD